MSSSGTLHTSAPNSSGYCVSMMPISRPPLLPPWAPSCSTVVMPRCTRSFATAAKSSATRWRPSRIAWVCQRRPVLAAAADVGHHVGAAARQPQPAEHAVIARRPRHLEPAVAAEQRRAGPVAVAVTDHEVRDRGAVLRCGEVLVDGDVVGVEERRVRDLICSSGPSTVPCSSRDGVVNPLESRKISSPRSSMSTMTALVLSGMPGTGSDVPTARRHGLHAAGDVGERDDDQLVLRPRVVVAGWCARRARRRRADPLCLRGIRRSRRRSASRPG